MPDKGSNITSQSNRPLFSFTKETYDGPFNEHVLDQYNLYVQSAENVSARRLTSNRHMLTLNVALVALYGFQFSSHDPSLLMVLIPIAGILVSWVWLDIIKSYKDLNTVKFKIIHELEKYLPAALYAHEWQLTEEGKGTPYRAVTTIESWIPRAFLVLHVIAFAILFVPFTIEM